MHCVTEYPAPNEELNLKAISTLKNEFNLPTGYSDHSEGIIIPIAASAIGVSVIEKHFTLDKAMEGPDHLASLEPTDLREMIIAIRSIETAMGNGEKIASSSEIKNKDIARKSIVAKTNIKKGEKYTKNNIAIRRPGKGMPPNNYWSLLNHSASSNYEEGDYIDE
ncbi:MAG: N-acetylneuraminate synthase family protein [Gammaproteobacteria bacterium]|nr:N-acetylneuraminate synthase family protein [Gammaproteobacteria bacterium]